MPKWLCRYRRGFSALLLITKRPNGSSTKRETSSVTPVQPVSLFTWWSLGTSETSQTGAHPAQVVWRHAKMALQRFRIQPALWTVPDAIRSGHFRVFRGFGSFRDAALIRGEALDVHPKRRQGKRELRFSVDAPDAVGGRCPASAGGPDWFRRSDQRQQGFGSSVPVLPQREGESSSHLLQIPLVQPPIIGARRRRTSVVEPTVARVMPEAVHRCRLVFRSGLAAPVGGTVRTHLAEAPSAVSAERIHQSEVDVTIGWSVEAQSCRWRLPGWSVPSPNPRGGLRSPQGGGDGPEPPGGQPDISITETLNWLKRRFHVEGGVWWLDGREDPAPFTAMWLMDRLYLNNRVINSDYGQDSKYGNRAGHLCEACGSPSSPFLSTCQLIRPIVETSAASGVPWKAREFCARFHFAPANKRTTVLFKSESKSRFTTCGIVRNLHMKPDIK